MQHHLVKRSYLCSSSRKLGNTVKHQCHLMNTPKKLIKYNKITIEYIAKLKLFRISMETVNESEGREKRGEVA